MTLTPPSPGAPRHHRLLIACAALCLAAGLSALGFWQLSRAEVKAERAERLRQESRRPAWTEADWPCEGVPPADLPVHRSVRLRGEWWHERTVLLDNRSLDGRSGLIVVTPLKLERDQAGCGPGVVLVQRGWIPRDPRAPRDAAHLPSVPRTTGRVEVRGRLMTELSRVYQLGQEDPPSGSGPVLRQNADAAFWRQWLGQSPLVGAVLQLQAESASPDGLSRAWPQVDEGRGKHLGYAAQWFAMAAVITGLYVWHQLIRPRRASGRNLADERA